jgi:hypothetical protein
MLSSERYDVVRDELDDWFDPILTIDTRLFLDPFLIYANEIDLFKGSHEEVIAFFDGVFKLIARFGGDRASAIYTKALVQVSQI